MSNEKQNLPYIPHISGVSDVEGNTVNIELKPTADTYRLIFPDSNSLGYLLNDGVGTLSWSTGGSSSSSNKCMIYSNTGVDIKYELKLNTKTILNYISTLYTDNLLIFTSPNNGIIKYKDTLSKYINITSTINIHPLNSNRVVKIHLYKNETSIYSLFKHFNNAEYNICSFSFVAELQFNDEISIRVEPISNNFDIHVYSYNIICVM